MQRICVCVWVFARARGRVCMCPHSGGHVGNWYLVVNVLCVTPISCVMSWVVEGYVCGGHGGLWGYGLRGLCDRERMCRQHLCSDWWGGGEMTHI